MNLVRSLYSCPTDDAPFFVDSTTECKPCVTPSLKEQLSCPYPKCATCEVAKARRCAVGAKKTKRNPKISPALKVDHLNPGDCMSVDQYLAGVPGRLPHTRGQESRSNRYHGGTLFFNHASSKIFVRHQVSLNGPETVQAKQDVERKSLVSGVYVKEYHADNGIFKARAFEDALLADNQLISFSGVGAKHQNGIAERAIGVVQNMARAMLLHVQIHWPEELMLVYGCLPLITLFGYTIIFHKLIEAVCALRNYLREQNMDVGFCNAYASLDVQRTFLPLDYRMERRFLNGNLEHELGCSWVFPHNILPPSVLY